MCAYNNKNTGVLSMKNSNITAIKIDEVDESWALKLLNESEQEDNSPIFIQNQLSSNHPLGNDISEIHYTNNPPSYAAKQSSDEAVITVDRAEIILEDNDISSVDTSTAIQRQVMEFAARAKLKRTNSLEGSGPTKSNKWIKTFFESKC